jgi:hypothetical protein
LPVAVVARPSDVIHMKFVATLGALDNERGAATWKRSCATASGS